MYTRYKGVRIGIDEMPFKTYRVNDKFVSLLQNPMSFGPDYMISSFTNEAKLFDIVYVEDPQEEIKKLKEVASSLLQKIKAKIAELDHWTDKQETKAEVDNLIRDTLWAELPESYDELSISTYRQRIYEYIYTRYKDVA